MASGSSPTRRNIAGLVAIPGISGPVPTLKRKVSKDDLKWKYAMALDFGTTRSGYCGFAYDSDQPPYEASGGCTWAMKKSDSAGKEPTILLVRLSDRRDFSSFAARLMQSHEPLPQSEVLLGLLALQRLLDESEEANDDADEDEDEGCASSAAPTSGCHGWYKASDFKMLLDLKTRQEEGKEKVISLKADTVPLKPLWPGGTVLEAPLLDVVALYLRGCSDIAKVNFQKTCDEKKIPAPTPEKISWAVTVPAIWRDQARMFMREAAVKANIVSAEAAKTRLKICLEPEGAGLEAIVSEIFANNRDDVLKKDGKYIVCDLGGGTADMTVQSLSTFSMATQRVEIDDEAVPSGGPWGGRLINSNFEQAVLKPLLGNELFQQYKQQPHPEVLLLEFEEAKKGFNGTQSAKVDLREIVDALDLDAKALELLKSRSKDIADLTLAAKRGTCTITLKVPLMEKLFDSVLEPIAQHLMQLARQHKTDVIFLVGGMCVNEYAKAELKKRLGPQGMDVFVPDNAGLSVVRGAARFARDDGSFGIRKARATYGIALYNKANPDRSFFRALIKRQDALMEIEKQTNATPLGPYTPLTEDQTAVSFQLYETDEMDDSQMPQYVDDPRVTFIAKTSVPVDRRLPFAERKSLIKFKIEGPSIVAIVISPDKSETALAWETR